MLKFCNVAVKAELYKQIIICTNIEIITKCTNNVVYFMISKLKSKILCFLCGKQSLLFVFNNSANIIYIILVKYTVYNLIF